MTFLLWHRGSDLSLASDRLVLRAAEVPFVKDAFALCGTLERLQADAERRIAAAEGEARARGHAQGREAGEREAREHAAETLMALTQASERERARLRDEVGLLALQVVRKLLGPFAADAVLAALAETAARDMLPAQPLALVVHPDQCQAVRERLAAAPGLDCELRSDPSCAPDACRIETAHGSVDASLETQLARLASAWGLA